MPSSEPTSIGAWSGPTALQMTSGNAIKDGSPQRRSLPARRELGSSEARIREQRLPSRIESASSVSDSSLSPLSLLPQGHGAPIHSPLGQPRPRLGLPARASLPSAVRTSSVRDLLLRRPLGISFLASPSTSSSHADTRPPITSRSLPLPGFIVVPLFSPFDCRLDLPGSLTSRVRPVSVGATLSGAIHPAGSLAFDA